MTKFYAEIITIGDEILYGQTNDTNSFWISKQLDDLGIKVVRKTTVGDNREDILTSFTNAESRANVVIITGGLGATNDDLTKPLLAEYFKCKLKVNEDSLNEIKTFFKSRNKELTPLVMKQAEIPTCAQRIPNKWGTASAIWIEKREVVFVSLPGVPYEMKQMMEDVILPKFSNLFGSNYIYHKIIRTIGIGESKLAQMINPWERNLPNYIKLAYLPSLGEVKLRLTSMGGTIDINIEKEIKTQIGLLKQQIGKYIYGYGNESIQNKIGEMLIQNKLSISFAESCTGGYVSKMITSVSGSSNYFRGSIIPYSNDLKEELLNINPEKIIKYGSVSKEVVIDMAINVRKLLKSDIGVAISGIAGPSGGTNLKPVGTVWIAYAGNYKIKTQRLSLSKNRMLNIKSSSMAALDLIRKSLMNII